MITIRNVRRDDDLLTLDIDVRNDDPRYREFEDVMLHDFVRHDNASTVCDSFRDTLGNTKVSPFLIEPNRVTHIMLRSDYEFIHDFFERMHRSKLVTDDDYHRIDMICRYQ